MKNAHGIKIIGGINSMPAGTPDGALKTMLKTKVKIANE